ncbi:hypothetical protein P154DRAFT_574439 [Amniculicola lignicola CBS 123094]|uniref:RING-type domain-containing protein n=1 Tax=Amniculicola lignicola CBS 123094 TaxID=1392246 RepID=A0A6A5WWW7_9PLEO|nr:hypothetical protein P154DRAFT_574439 [Amniculicola lignicola CBS 123094]
MANREDRVSRLKEKIIEDSFDTVVEELSSNFFTTTNSVGTICKETFPDGDTSATLDERVVETKRCHNGKAAPSIYGIQSGITIQRRAHKAVYFPDRISSPATIAQMEHFNDDVLWPDPPPLIERETTIINRSLASLFTRRTPQNSTAVLIQFFCNGAEAVPNNYFEATSTVCPICQETIPEGDPTLYNGVVKTTLCGHTYHHLCLHSWLVTGARTCPLDRQVLFGLEESEDDFIHLLDLWDSDFSDDEWSDIEADIVNYLANHRISLDEFHDEMARHLRYFDVDDEVQDQATSAVEDDDLPVLQTQREREEEVDQEVGNRTSSSVVYEPNLEPFPPQDAQEDPRGIWKYRDYERPESDSESDL